MMTLLFLGAFDALYGLAGLLGWQAIPEKYRGHDWTGAYIRYRGISGLMIGIPWLLLYAAIRGRELPYGIVCLWIVAAALPAVVYTFVQERKYRKLLKKA